MKIFKKVLGFFIILMLLQANILYAKEHLPTKLYIAKKNLEKIKNGNKYEKIINNFVNKASEEKLKKLQYRIKIAKEKLKENNSIKAKNLKVVISYLELLIDYKLNNIPQENLEQISKEDKDFIEKEILKLQYSLGNNINDFIKNISKDFNKLTKYEEKGNFKIDFNLDYDEIGKTNGKIEFKNYYYKNNFLDSQFTTNIDLQIDSKIKNDIERKLDINGNLDHIEKNGIMYFFIKKLDIKNKKGFENIEFYLQKLEKIAKENKYIKIEDKQNKEAINLIKSLNIKKLNSDINNIFSKPLFEAYQKSQNKYYLKPTKYACDKLKEISNKFDPINGKACSISQYNDLIKEIDKKGKLYLEINKNSKKLVFIFNKTSNLDNGNIVINFDNNKINYIKATITPNQDKFKNEGLKFEYKYKKYLVLNLNTDKQNILTNLKINLNNNNKINELYFNIKNINQYNSLIANFKLKNNNIKGNLNFKDKYYSWKEEKYLDNNDFNLTINGTTKKWELKAINKNLKNNTILLKTNLKNNYGKINGETYINDISGNLILKCNHNGRFSNNYIDLKNKIIFDKNYTKTFFNTDNNLEANFNIKYSNINNNYDFILLINGLIDNKEIFKFETNSNFKRIYKSNIEIKTPTNTLNLEEIK